MVVKIVPNESGTVPGKLADAELHFTDGVLAGLKLIGFGVWERRGGGPARNVTFPSRAYSVNGERRNFALLRPVLNGSQDAIRNLILSAYAEYERAADGPVEVPAAVAIAAGAGAVTVPASAGGALSMMAAALDARR